MSRSLRFGSVLLGLATAATAHAAINIVVADFDLTDPTYVYGYVYGATNPTRTHSVVPGIGVGGSDALQQTWTFGTIAEGWAGAGFGAGQTFTSAPFWVTPSLADFSYTVTFDASGFLDTTGTTDVTLEFIFAAPDGTLGPVNGSDDVLVELDRTFPFNRSGGFQTFSGTLDTHTFGVGTLANLTTHFSLIRRAQLNVNWPNGSHFGFDTVPNQIIMDNLTWTVIPEPTVAFIGLAGSLGLLIRRRAAAV